MHVDPAAILALIAEQQTIIMSLQQTNHELREQLAQTRQDESKS